MPRTPLLAALTLTLWSLLLPGEARAQTGHVLAWTGEFYALDLGTGSTSLQGTLGWGQANALAMDEAGNLLTILDNGSRLVQIDPTTGGTVQLATVDLLDVRALAVEPGTGRILAVVDATANGTVSDALWSIDPVTYQKQFVGLTGAFGLQGLDHSPSGVLYGWDIGDFVSNGPGLVTVDPISGLATPVATGVDNGVNEQTLAFAVDGSCYVIGSSVVGSSVYLVDTNTGAKVWHSSLAASLLRGLELPLPIVGSPFCAAAANSTGAGALLTALGSAGIADDGLYLSVSGLPPNQFGYFVMGQTSAVLPVGQGLLCIGLPFVRFDQDILDSGPFGRWTFQPQLGNLPQSTVIQPGDVWLFQCWYRDTNPGQTSNLSDGVQITFL